MQIQVQTFENREQRIVHIVDEQAGARGFIVVDSTHLGPAMGGCRVWPYASDEAALYDCQRLARGMSYKNAMAGLSLGGGKAVLRLPAGPFDRRAFFEAFGRAVAFLGGEYLTAEDVGTSEGDMQFVRAMSPHVFGLPHEATGRAGGNPSPWTAKGVFIAMNAVMTRYGRSLAGSHVAVQGLGNVGRALCELLLNAGAKVTAADPSASAVEQVCDRVSIVDPADIHKVPASIFAPCALGGTLNHETIPQLDSPMVIGAANNQLATSEAGESLLRAGIMYVPDYVVNAGGVINVAAEAVGESLQFVEQKLDLIGLRTMQVLDAAEGKGISPSRAADVIAMDLLGIKDFEPAY